MKQTFADRCDERQTSGHLFGFVLWIFAETSAGIMRENLELNHMKNMTNNPHVAAIAGLLFVLPFLVLNAVVANQIEPFISMLRPDTHTNLVEQVLLFFLLLVLPLSGAFVAIRPSLRKGPDETRRLHLLGTLVAAMLIVGSVTLSTALGMEMYECDVLKVPNCD